MSLNPVPPPTRNLTGQHWQLLDFLEGRWITFQHPPILSARGSMLRLPNGVVANLSQILCVRGPIYYLAETPSGVVLLRNLGQRIPPFIILYVRIPWRDIYHWNGHIGIYSKNFFISPRFNQPRCTTSYTTMQITNQPELTFQETAYRREWSSHLEDSSIELNTLSLFTNLPPTERRALLLKEMSYIFAAREDDFGQAMVQGHSFHTILYKCSAVPREFDPVEMHPFLRSMQPVAFLWGERKYIDWKSMIVWVSVYEVRLRRWLLPIARGMLGFDILHPELPKYALAPSILRIRYFHRIVSPLVHRLPFFDPLDLKEGAYNAPPAITPSRFIGRAHHIIILRDLGVAALPWETQTTPWGREEAQQRHLRRSQVHHERGRRSDVSEDATIVEEVEEDHFQPQELWHGGNFYSIFFVLFYALFFLPWECVCLFLFLLLFLFLCLLFLFLSLENNIWLLEQGRDVHIHLDVFMETNVFLLDSWWAWKGRLSWGNQDQEGQIMTWIWWWTLMDKDQDQSHGIRSQSSTLVIDTWTQWSIP